ncbi:MAG: DUF4492 domain-containing protein [Alistipes sp.]|nr:DUF4492 domain-containing protein [Rikenellaceae bacterium]MBQ3149151.1 DUF4492 domain-containing protein [Alistipes sp.]MBQ4127914.1 DUF4492 domain-containing protein [Alistipes sp.]
MAIMRRLIAIWDFYVDGFRSMTWGRQLWWLILLKVIILFAVLRAFFFRPTLAGKDEQQRIEYIGDQLTNNPNYKLN